MSYDEADYGRSLWFVDPFDGNEKPSKSILSGHLVTLDEPDKPTLTEGPSDPAITLDMHSAAFETKFGGLATQDLFTANKRCVCACVRVCVCHSNVFINHWWETAYHYSINILTCSICSKP